MFPSISLQAWAWLLNQFLETLFLWHIFCSLSRIDCLAIRGVYHRIYRQRSASSCSQKDRPLMLQAHLSSIAHTPACNIWLELFEGKRIRFHGETLLQYPCSMELQTPTKSFRTSWGCRYQLADSSILLNTLWSLHGASFWCLAGGFVSNRWKSIWASFLVLNVNSLKWVPIIVKLIN